MPEWNKQRSKRGLDNRGSMIDLDYSLTIEATRELDFFGFYSPDLPGFSGIGHSIEDCIYKARSGMKDHVRTLADQGLRVPDKNGNPKITIENEKEVA